MDEHGVLLDAFAEARRTWDDMVTLQPDVTAGAGQLKDFDLAELARRVQAHRLTIDILNDVLETAAPLEPVVEPPRP